MSIWSPGYPGSGFWMPFQHSLFHLFECDVEFDEDVQMSSLMWLKVMEGQDLPIFHKTVKYAC